MTPKTFLAVAAVTGVAVLGAAAAVIVERNALAVPRLGDQPLFPRLASGLGSVARIKIEAPRYSVVFERRGNTWLVADKGNYAARAGAVTRLIGDIAGMRPSETKTDNPNLYSRVAVEDRAAADSKSKLVTVENDQGQALARFIMGKQSQSIGFSPLGGTFVRLPGEAQTWLAEGSPIIPDNIGEWFDQIVHVPGTKVKRMVVYEGEKVVYEAAKTEEDKIGRAHV